MGEVECGFNREVRIDSSSCRTSGSFQNSVLFMAPDRWMRCGGEVSEAKPRTWTDGDEEDEESSWKKLEELSDFVGARNVSEGRRARVVVAMA